MYAQLGKEALRDAENDSAVRDGGIINLNIRRHPGRDD
jgi:hypothetical protein